MPFAIVLALAVAAPWAVSVPDESRQGNQPTVPSFGLPAVFWPGVTAPRLILVRLDRQRLGRYEYGHLVASYPISSGKPGHRTPTGWFWVSGKDWDHRSSVYPEPIGGAPMPYGVRFRYDGYWIHGGWLPGYPASHGCIRLGLPAARKLYRWSRLGTPVVVVRSLPKPP